MLIARSLGEIGKLPDSAVTVGTFDGVHSGHRAILKELTARASGGRSVVITFDPHPRTVVGTGEVRQLSNLGERLELIGSLGVDAALVLEFTKEFSRLSPKEFYVQYLINGVGMREVIVGYDHMFGHEREAGIKEIRQLGREFGFEARVVDPVSVGGRIVTSSRIRELLLQGAVERAEECLGRPYSLTGTVVKSDGRGTGLGFPTANIEPEFQHKLVPADGVYLVGADLGGVPLYGMLNIGYRPTFKPAGGRTIEVHLFDFSEMIYTRKLKMFFLKRLRAEKKFASVDDLVRQLNADRDACLRHISALQLILNSGENQCH